MMSKEIDLSGKVSSKHNGLLFFLFQISTVGPGIMLRVTVGPVVLYHFD